uniref:Uncharacterized protein n=1 Tax=Strigamia maritima TaxID=126957 RepID=T1J5G3_STRMM
MRVEDERKDDVFFGSEISACFVVYKKWRIRYCFGHLMIKIIYFLSEIKMLYILSFALNGEEHCRNDK